MATENLDGIYEGAGKYWNVDPHLLRAVHQVEDPTNDPNAVSPAGAVGHMQFMPDTARALGIDPHDPKQSIYGAARLLDENLRRYGNVPDALRAYNGGTDRTRWGNHETSAYPGKVATAYHASKENHTMPQEDDAFSRDFGPYLKKNIPASSDSVSSEPLTQAPQSNTPPKAPLESTPLVDAFTRDFVRWTRFFGQVVKL